MFKGYTMKASEFLWGIAFNNERSWFLDHKEEYENEVNAPTKALAAECCEIMRERFPSLNFSYHVARIYRDARRLYGKGPYKDHLWFAIYSGLTDRDGPAFWFEIGAHDITYGMGYWMVTAPRLEAFRKSIDANPARFEGIAAKLAEDKNYRIFGQEYKKPKGSCTGAAGLWYNRKQLGVEHREDFGGNMLKPEFPVILADEYTKLVPLMEYFIENYLTVV